MLSERSNHLFLTELNVTILLLYGALALPLATYLYFGFLALGWLTCAPWCVERAWLELLFMGAHRQVVCCLVRHTQVLVPLILHITMQESMEYVQRQPPATRLAVGPQILAT